jgi:hypothetical protein
MARKKTSTKTGRPRTTGAGTQLMVRMHTPQLQELDRWKRNAGISRPEAVRQLVSWALPHATKPPVEPAIYTIRRARERLARRL